MFLTVIKCTKLKAFNYFRLSTLKLDLSRLITTELNVFKSINYSVWVGFMFIMKDTYFMEISGEVSQRCRLSRINAIRENSNFESRQ